ncbi:MAG: leucine--tRNA ligase, partial [bacterium]|nr:leucine--tRNA ligase [bacterium]
QGLAYKKEIPVNWCPKDKINLANEEVIQGACERCGTPVERRMQSQWLLKITEYADRLLDDLDKVDYRKDIRDQQINWIGRSEGARIKFLLRGVPGQPAVEVFTTRADTLFGATFLVISPELAQQWIGRGWSAPAKVSSYVHKTLNRPELERQKEKTGVSAEINACHPLTGDEIPVWISSYVLAGYGTGAVMGVPAHDQRDLEFAQKFDLSIQEVIQNKPESNFPKEAFEGEGTLINSGEFEGLDSSAGADKITGRLEKEDLGATAVDYKLRDWVFSRQHYWGEPIPIIICEEHGFVPVPEENLPVELPYVKKFQPTDTGESPLAGVKDWVKVDCPICGKQARRETDTMPNWAGSSWYFLRYLDPENRQQFADRKKLDYWMPVDWYNGGMEHTTLHLLYSRFWYKVMADLKLVPGEEPYAKRTSHGVVLGPDGQKMSKSRGNVVNPDEVVAEFGADAFRLYEAFIGPFEQMIPWDPRGILGVRRFLDKVWKAHQEITAQEAGSGSEELERALHRLIKKVEEDTLTLNFNTAVSAMMEFVNLLSSQEYRLTIDAWKTFLKVLAPYAPHLGEELYQNLVRGDKKSVHLEAW